MKLFPEYFRGGRRTRQNSAGKWHCYKCNRYKPASAYFRMKPYERPQSMCKECGIQHSREWRRKQSTPPPTPDTLRGSRY